VDKHNIISALQNVIDEIRAAPEADDPEVVVVEEVTPAKISENVSGNPRLYIDQPELYAKMERFYDEKREPFTTQSWQRTVMGFGDTRPWKPIMLNGIEVRPVPKQAASGDWYAISRGFIWEGDRRDPGCKWYKRLTAEDGITEIEALMYFETCPMDGLSTRGWPRRYRDAYEDRGW
jgi:hypothetical protein